MAGRANRRRFFYRGFAYFWACAFLRQVLLGGNWDDRSKCGSRTANCNNFSSNGNANNAARLRSDTLVFSLNSYGWANFLLARENTKRKLLSVSSASKSRKWQLNMKRHGNLWDKIIDIENLKAACNKAAKGKRDRENIQRVLSDIDSRMNILHESLKNGTYRTASYDTRVIHEPKERTIYILPFYPDRIVHHAIMRVVEPIWDKLMIHDSYACRLGKGQHAGSKRCMEFVRKYDYCLKCDVSKFYPSVDHAILKQIIKRKIKDTRLLNLMDEIIDSEKCRPISTKAKRWFSCSLRLTAKQGLFSLVRWSL